MGQGNFLKESLEVCRLQKDISAIPTSSVMSLSAMEQMYEESSWRLYDRIQRSRNIFTKAERDYSRKNLGNSLRTILLSVNDENDYLIFDDAEDEVRSVQEDHERLQDETEDDAIFELNM